MSLRLQAAADCAAIHGNTNEFGWPITVTSPDGSSAELVGLSGDISTTIDPDTGMTVSGRRAHVSLAISALLAAGLSLPRNVADSSIRPWVVTFADINGISHTFKVIDAIPDRTIGNVVCLLEAYEP